MPAKKKAARKTTKRTAKKTTKKAAAKKTYICIPCGTEVTVTKHGMGVTRLMCCGRVMKPKSTRRC